MQEHFYTVSDRKYPVQRYIEGIPVLNIPMMSDERWTELNRRCAACIR